jgi:hypothetical protein
MRFLILHIFSDLTIFTYIIAHKIESTNLCSNQHCLSRDRLGNDQFASSGIAQFGYWRMRKSHDGFPNQSPSLFLVLMKKRPVKWPLARLWPFRPHNKQSPSNAPIFACIVFTCYQTQHIIAVTVRVGCTKYGRQRLNSGAPSNYALRRCGATSISQSKTGNALQRRCAQF